MVQINTGIDAIDADWADFKPHYDKLQIGVFSNRNEADVRGRLDELLEAFQIQYSDYLIYCVAEKVSCFHNFCLLQLLISIPTKNQLLESLVSLFY